MLSTRHVSEFSFLTARLLELQLCHKKLDINKITGSLTDDKKEMLNQGYRANVKLK